MTAKPTRIRLVVSDVDGTLVRHDKSLSDGNVAAVHRLLDAGIAFTLISARPPSGILPLAERLGLDGPVGAYNGATIVGIDGAVIAADHLEPALASRTLALLDRAGVAPWLFADGHWYAQTLDNPHVPRERQSAMADAVICPDFAPLLARVDKIVGVSDDHDGLARLELEVAAALGDGANVIRSQAYYLDVTAPTGNKGDGVTALAAAFGVDLTEVAVLGDQRNDLAMFARVPLSVAMGQGPQEVRDAATHVAAPNDEDGVADAIDRFVLVP